MMPKSNPTKKNIGVLRILLPFVLLLLNGSTALADEAGSQTQMSDPITAGEILLYVAIVIGVILLAWFLASGQMKNSNRQDVTRPYHPHRHFDHPNDPHFRKIRKKTS